MRVYILGAGTPTPTPEPPPEQPASLGSGNIQALRRRRAAVGRRAERGGGESSLTAPRFLAQAVCLGSRRGGCG